jgi:hypothetical protein
MASQFRAHASSLNIVSFNLNLQRVKSECHMIDPSAMTGDRTVRVVCYELQWARLEVHRSVILRWNIAVHI